MDRPELSLTCPQDVPQTPLEGHQETIKLPTNSNAFPREPFRPSSEEQARAPQLSVGKVRQGEPKERSGVCRGPKEGGYYSAGEAQALARGIADDI